MKYARKQDRGFTLIELLVVISIIGMLSSIVLASLSAARYKGRVASGAAFFDQNYHLLGVDSFLIHNFNDTATTQLLDSSGNNRTETCNTSIPRSTDVPFGGGRSLTLLPAGASGTQCNFSNKISPIKPQMLISFWVKFTNTSGTFQIETTDQYNNNVYLIYADFGQLQFTGDSVGGSLNAPGVFQAGKWYNITYAIDYTKTKKVNLYIDGKKYPTSLDLTGITPYTDITNFNLFGNDGYVSNLNIYNDNGGL